MAGSKERLTQSPRAIREGNADPYHDGSSVELDMDIPGKVDGANGGDETREGTVEWDYSEYNAQYKDGGGSLG